jgi:hypothetical protein
MGDSGRFCPESLVFAAKAHILRGFAVIPVFGAADFERCKLPGIKWGRYQYCLPTDQDVEDWFLNQGFGGLAVVCGRVSRLAVLDFDDQDLASEFRRLFPDLAATYTVTSGTRGLPHLYWRLPAELIVDTRSVQGVDLRGEGSYVVAPPTRSASGEWRVADVREPHLLSRSDLSRVLRWMATKSRVSLENVVEPPSRSIPTPSQSRTLPSEFRHQLIPPDELQRRYQHLAQSGRNQALFQVALDARDSGWLEAALVVCLAVLHANQPPNTPDADSQSYQSRYAEAIRTIRSVYSRPRRDTAAVRNAERLGNPVREALLGRGLDACARVLDGLFLAGSQPGDILTEREMCERVAALGIGRRSVMNALNAALSDGAPVFAQPLCTPRSAAGAAAQTGEQINSCEMSRGAKRVKTPGRPPRSYVLPSSEALAARLGVKHLKGDPLRPSDLSSAAAYRRALHRTLLGRRPGQYPRRWLAGRLGVSEWTLRRYEQDAGIQARPMFAMQPLRAQKVEALLNDDVSDQGWGVFLEDDMGRRYPPLRSVALKLIGKGVTPRLMRQEPNYYSLGITVGIPTPAPTTATHGRLTSQPPDVMKRPGAASGYVPPTVGIPTPDPDARPTPEDTTVGIPTPGLQFWLCPDCMRVHLQIHSPDICRCGSTNLELVSDGIWRNVECLKQWWRTRCEEHQRRNSLLRKAQVIYPGSRSLPDAGDEQMAQRAHNEVSGLALCSARLLVERYGARAVGEGMKLLRQRANVRNPAGLLTVIARCEHKFYSARASNQSFTAASA